MYIKLFTFCSLLLIGLAACTPKTTEQTTETEEELPPPPEETVEADEELSPCPKFRDAPDPDGISDKYVIYRDFLRAGEWDQAFELWQDVYAVAPAADGRRNTVYTDGIRFYEYFMQQNPEQKEEYVDKIFELYDEIERCYSGGGFIPGMKGFDLYYKYPERAESQMQVYNLFKESIDRDSLKAQDFIINPFTSLLVDLYFEDKISQAEAKKYEQQIRAIVANGIEKCKGQACARWEIIAEYVPDRLQAFETVRGFYGCDYYKEKYYQDFLQDPSNCDTLRLVYSRLKWGNCPESDEDFAALIKAGNENCRTTGGPSVAREGYDCLQNADYDCAITKFQQAAAEADDVERKGNYLLLIAKVYYAHLRNFPEARRYARQAAEVRSGWGEPYILIGKLYASSGPLCGSGRGWNSQIVTWPAIDMWNRAKNIDSSVAAEANKSIRQYTQYMPSIEDIFQRGLKEGQSFTVGCWIQETTTIRAAPN